MIDLNPLDYSLWAMLKADPERHQLENLDQLQTFIEGKVPQINGNRAMLERVIRQFIPRCKAIMDADGGHIDSNDLKKFY